MIDDQRSKTEPTRRHRSATPTKINRLSAAQLSRTRKSTLDGGYHVDQRRREEREPVEESDVVAKLCAALPELRRECALDGTLAALIKIVDDVRLGRPVAHQLGEIGIDLRELRTEMVNPFPIHGRLLGHSPDEVFYCPLKRRCNRTVLADRPGRTPICQIMGHGMRIRGDGA